MKCLQVDRVRGLVRVSRKALLDPKADDDLTPYADPSVLKTLKVGVHTTGLVELPLTDREGRMRHAFDFQDI